MQSVTMKASDYMVYYTKLLYTVKRKTWMSEKDFYN